MAAILLACGNWAAAKSPTAAEKLADGAAAFNRGDYSDAISLLQGALPALKRSNDPRTADVLAVIGEAYTNLQAYPRALDVLRDALPLYRARKDRLREAAVLGDIGDAEAHLGRYDDALASERQALALDRALKNQLGEANALGTVSTIEQDLGRYDDALASCRQALVIHRALGNQFGEAADLNTIGIVETELGRYADALVVIGQSLAIARALKYPLGEANDLGDMGVVEMDLGRYDDALASHQQALAIDRALKQRLEEANNLDNIGNVEESLGRYADALALHQQALEIARELKDRLGEAGRLNNIGDVQVDLGRYGDASTSYRQAFIIDHALKNRVGEASDLANLGIVQEQLGHYAEALASYQQAVAIDRALKSRLGEGSNLQNIAMVENDLGRYDDALTTARAASVLNAQLSNPAVLWRSLSAEAIAEAHLGNRTEALAGYDAALEVIEGLRAGLNPSERTSFFGTTLFLYDRYIAYLVELNGKFPGQGYDRKALEVLERRSARAALEQIGQSAAQHFKGVPAEKIAEENAAKAAVEGAQHLLAKARSTVTGERTAETAAERDLADAQARAAALESGISAQYPAYYQLRHPQPLLVKCGQSPCLTISSFQHSVLRPGELMLVYDLLKEKSVLWLVDGDHVQLVTLPRSDQIDAAVARLGSHVSGILNLLEPGVRAQKKLEGAAAADVPAYAADSYALYRMLVPNAAAAALSRAKSLIVVPSGSLYRLAFETLVTQDPANAPQPHYLLEDAPISYVPSASLLAVVRASYAQPDAGRHPLLALADPAFGATSTGSAAPGAEGGLPAYAALQLAAVRSMLPSSGPSTVGDAVFPPLPGTQTEADAVRTALDAPSDSVIVGDGATRQRVLDLNKNGQLKAYQYLLFATHAVLPNEIKGLTQPAIVLAHPERGDGLLTMADVFDLSLDADFVMLSACDTGVRTADSNGGSISGGGISGLTRAFLYAGTPAISVTLWEVDDAAAPHTTPPFFAGMHAGKLTPAESLREAKLAMLKSPEARLRHPYAWAPGVIFGDGDGAPAR